MQYITMGAANCLGKGNGSGLCPVEDNCGIPE